MNQQRSRRFKTAKERLEVWWHGCSSLQIIVLSHSLNYTSHAMLLP